MDTRYLRKSRQHARGAVRPVTFAILAVFALFAIAAWLLIIKPHQAMMAADSGGYSSTPAAAASHAVVAPVNVEAMSVNQLLAEARKAMNEQRVLAPAGNNAFAFYLTALEKQPGNQVATDALRETFPFAATAAEQEINQRDFNEAQRQIDLLAKADPANYTLTILRSKLDAQRKVVDREQQQQADQQHQQQLVAQKASVDKVAAEQLAEQQKAQAAEQQQAQAQQAAHELTVRQQQRSAVAAAQPAVSAVNAAGGQTREAVLVKSALPRYPTTALRAGQEGWVDLNFTVAADGSVTDIKIADSQPHHVFDRAATEAVSHWKFDPALKNGSPVATTLQRRVEFKVNQ